MTETSAMEKVTALRETFDKKMIELQQTMRDAFKPAISELFEIYPDVESIRWEQYTPYFNDGDECIFGINEARVKFKDFQLKDKNGVVDNGDYDDGYYTAWDFYDCMPNSPEIEKKNIVKQISSFVEKFPEDVMKGIFGDHVSVTVNCDGTSDTEEYEHE